MTTKDKAYPNLDQRKFTNDSLDDHIQPDDDEIHQIIFDLGQSASKTSPGVPGLDRAVEEEPPRGCAKGVAQLIAPPIAAFAIAQQIAGCGGESMKPKNVKPEDVE